MESLQAGKERIRIEGNNVRIIIVEDGREFENVHSKIPPGIELRVAGDNNTVRLILPIVASDSTIAVEGNDHSIEIGPSPQFDQVRIRLYNGSGSRLVIGRDTTFEGATIMVPDSSSCLIGEDCLFANGVQIHSADSRTMYDRLSGRILNAPNHPTRIGNHCWVGLGARVFKNGWLADNTVVGGMAVVTKRFKQEHVVIGGNPARIIRSGVSWDRRSHEDFRHAMHKPLEAGS